MSQANILVVDDKIENLRLLCSALNAQGYEVRPILSGEGALRAAFVSKPDLILLDISLLDTDGFTVCRALKSNSDMQDIPVIFISALHDTQDKVRAFSVGGVDYITKPFQIDEVLARVETQLQMYWQRRELQALHRQNVSRVAMFAHDFRVPLATIMASVSMVRQYAERLEEDDRRECLYRAEISVRQLTQMLDDMLMTARLEAGALQLQIESLNLPMFIRGIVLEFEIADGGAHQIEVELHGESIFPTDPRLMRQILINLISNAIKYSRAGTTISIRASLDREQLTLVICDAGIGIPKDDLPFLFRAFQRGSNVSKISGTGLGLAIVKRATDILGGSLHVQSEVGKGTCFKVSIPVNLNSFANGAGKDSASLQEPVFR